MKRIAFLLILVLFTRSQSFAGLNKELVVFLSFDNVKGKRILDASGNDLDAEIIANVDFIEGKYGNALHVAAAAEGDECVHIPADNLLKLEDKITMMAWVFNERCSCGFTEK